jgi:hypothetical protein
MNTQPRDDGKELCCPVCGQPHCPNPQGPLVLMTPATAHQLMPGDTFHWYTKPHSADQATTDDKKGVQPID